MRRRLIVLSLLAAWLCANGALLDVEQAYAWGRMFVGYVRTTPIVQAAAETFDPAKPCAICQAVQQARQAAPKPNATAPAGQLTLACPPSEVIVRPAPARDWTETVDTFAPARREGVLLRPPRLGGA